MTKQITITIADMVNDDINNIMSNKNKINKSEVIEEIIRLGLPIYKEKNKMGVN